MALPRVSGMSQVYTGFPERKKNAQKASNKKKNQLKRKICGLLATSMQIYMDNKELFFQGRSNFLAWLVVN